MRTLRKSRNLVTCSVTSVFEARPITPATLRAAFAVMQLAVPAANLQDFRKKAGGKLASPAGMIFGLFDKRDYIHAIFRAQMEHTPGQPIRLRVSEFTHGDSISTAIVLEMIDAIETMARSHGCERISIEAARSEMSSGLPLTDVLVARGFSGESLVMARRI